MLTVGEHDIISFNETRGDVHHTFYFCNVANEFGLRISGPGAPQAHTSVAVTAGCGTAARSPCSHWVV
jgi:hypothetical protein